MDATQNPWFFWTIFKTKYTKIIAIQIILITIDIDKLVSFLRFYNLFVNILNILNSFFVFILDEILK